MNPKIFREYDIRGVVETDLPIELVNKLGRALGTVAKKEGKTEFALGRDCRLTGASLREALVDGLLSSGINVTDVGEVPTPLLYFSVHHLDTGGGVQITGSHNPPEYNGFKMMMGKGTLHGTAIQHLRSLIESEDFVSSERGTLTETPMVDRYVDWVLDNIGPLPKKLKIVVDGGNGMGGPAAVQLFEALGAEVIPLFIEPDGNFPNHHPDPTVTENLQDLIAKVRETGADLGVGFDGDGDRIGVVDERGEIIWGDRLMIILARAVLKEVPGAAIVGEVKCSQALYDEIERAGGRPIMWKTGHSLIKSKMKEENAALAGEMSGHIFFKHRYFGFDDAIYTGSRLMEILANHDGPLSSLLEDVAESYVTPEIRVDCSDEIKFGVATGLAQRFGKEFNVLTIDGARVTFDDGAWALVRASNTQPALVLRVEAGSEARRDEVLAWLQSAVNQAIQDAT